MINRLYDNWIAILLAVLPFLLGGFFLWTSVLVSLALLAVLLVGLYRRKTITISSSWGFLAPVIITAAYLLTVFWAQDRGMALPGFFKFLPLGLLALAVWQEPAEKRTVALEVIPWSGAVMTVLCVPLSYLPLVDGHLLVNGRQGGLFEYPNTYALFLLLGLVILATRETYRWYHGILALVLLAGIFLSGSRTVFVLLLLAALVLALARKGVVRIAVLVAVPLTVVAAAAYALASGNTASIGRFLTTSLHSSTLMGRLLYAHDALSVILRHPLGLGYGSYAVMQGSFQTGVYTVQSVHNDLLQLMLDAGWAPAGTVVIAVVKTIFRKGTTLRNRLVLSVLCAHALLDFSMQFLAISAVLVLLLADGSPREVPIKKNDRRFLTAVCGVLMTGALYFGAVSGLAYLGCHDATLALDGAYTDSLMARMSSEEDLARADDYARRILALNRYAAPAYRVRAAYAYSQGDFQTVIDQQRRAIACAPYDLSAYTDYLDMLSVGVQLYESAGDTASAETCRQQMRQVPALLQATIEKTSPLGWQIADKPALTLPEKYLTMLNAL